MYRSILWAGVSSHSAETVAMSLTYWIITSSSWLCFWRKNTSSRNMSDFRTVELSSTKKMLRMLHQKKER